MSLQALRLIRRTALPRTMWLGDDLRGNVACGAMKEPTAVYVTWKEGPQGAKQVVAVEFLPKPPQ